MTNIFCCALVIILKLITSSQYFLVCIRTGWFGRMQLLKQKKRVYLSVKTCEAFICFVAIVRVTVI